MIVVTVLIFENRFLELRRSLLEPGKVVYYSFPLLETETSSRIFRLLKWVKFKLSFFSVYGCFKSIEELAILPRRCNMCCFRCILLPAAEIASPDSIDFMFSFNSVGLIVSFFSPYSGLPEFADVLFWLSRVLQKPLALWRVRFLAETMEVRRITCEFWFLRPGTS